MFKFIQNLFNKSLEQSTAQKEKLSIQYALEAETERKLGNLDVALSCIEKAIDKEANNDMFYITQALIYKDKNDFDRALISINKAIELNDKVIMTKEIKEEIEKNISF